jgi:hypothetical protein
VSLRFRFPLYRNFAAEAQEKMSLTLDEVIHLAWEKKSNQVSLANTSNHQETRVTGL